MTDRAGRARLVVAGTLLADEVLTLAAPAEPGTQQRAQAHRVDGGGQVWHTARAGLAAGLAVTVAGRRGADAVGVHLAAELVAAGAQDLLIASGPSRRAVVLIAADCERAIVSVPESAPAPVVADGPGWVDRVLQGAAWLHLDGYALDAVTGDLLVGLAREAADRGIPISLEPPSLAGLPARRAVLPELPPLTLVVGRPDEVLAAGDLIAGPPQITVTHDGPRPVRWWAPIDATEPVAVAHPGEVPTRGPIDTLGAGDRFAGGLLAGLLRGERPRDCLLAGIVSAASGAERSPERSTADEQGAAGDGKVSG